MADRSGEERLIDCDPFYRIHSLSQYYLPQTSKCIFQLLFPDMLSMKRFKIMIKANNFQSKTITMNIIKSYFKKFKNFNYRLN